MTRTPLPNRRGAETFSLRHRHAEHVFTISRFKDGRVAEVFARAYYGGGSDGETDARDAAIILSLALQHGAALETIAHAITRDDAGAPCSIVGAIVDVLTEKSI